MEDEGPEGLGLGVCFFFPGDISLKRFGDVFLLEVGKNAKVLVQLRNFPKVGFLYKVFQGMGVKQYIYFHQ